MSSRQRIGLDQGWRYGLGAGAIRRWVRRGTCSPVVGPVDSSNGSVAASGPADASWPSGPSADRRDNRRPGPSACARRADGDRDLDVRLGSWTSTSDSTDFGLGLVALLARLVAARVPDPQHPGAEGDDQGREGEPDADVDQARRPHHSGELVRPGIKHREHRAVGIEHLLDRHAHELERRERRSRRARPRPPRRRPSGSSARSTGTSGRARGRSSSPIAPPATPEAAVTANRLATWPNEMPPSRAQSDSSPTLAPRMIRMFRRPATSLPRTISRSLRSVIEQQVERAAILLVGDRGRREQRGEEEHQRELEHGEHDVEDCRRTAPARRARGRPASR